MHCPLTLRLPIDASAPARNRDKGRRRRLSPEWVKTLISVLSNGGLALFGAFAAVPYNGDGTDDSLAMAFIGLILISVSMALTRALREEGWE